MVEVIGVYEVPENNDASIVEVVVKKRHSEFDMGDFSQAQENRPRESWQAPFNEKYLDEEGENIIGDWFNEPTDNLETTRVAFFIYFLDTNKPLVTPFEEVNLPEKCPIPIRLAGKMPFEDPE